MRAAAVELLDAAHEQDLKGRHERRGAGAIQNFSQAYFGEIKIVQAEVAQVRRNKVLEQRLAALVAKENFIADEHVCGAETAAGNVGGEFLRCGKAAPGASRY